MTNIRPIEPSEISRLAKHLTNSLSNLECSYLGFVPTMDHIESQTIKDPDFDPKLLLGLFEDGELIGSTLGIARPWKKEDCHIKWLTISPSHRNQGFGEKLLKSIENKMHLQGVKTLIFGSSSPRYFLPGVPMNNKDLAGLLFKNGWKDDGIRVSLFADIAKNNIIRDELYKATKNEADYKFSLTTEENSATTLLFVKSEFDKSWATEVEMALAAGNKIGSVVIATEKATGEIIGFASLNGSNPNWFGPMGVKKSCQKKGLGRVLVKEALIIARNQGMKSIILPWINGKEEFYPRFFRDYTWLKYINVYKDIA